MSSYIVFNFHLGFNKNINVSKDQVCDHLKILNINNSQEADALRELADVVAEPFAMILEKSWQSGLVPSIGPIFIRPGNVTLGMTDLPASCLCLGKSYERSL